MNRWVLRFSLGILGLVVVILVLIGILLHLNQDLPPENVSDVLGQKEALPFEENAYHLILGALSEVNPRQVHEVSGAVYEKKNDAQIRVQEMLNSHEPFFQKIEAATSARVFQVDVKTQFHSLFYVDEADTLYQFKVQSEMEAGELGAAIESAVHAMKLSSLLLQDPESFMTHFTYLRFLEHSGVGYLMLIRTGKLSLEQLRRLQTQLPPKGIAIESVLPAARNQLQFLKHHFETSADEPSYFPMLSGYKLHPNRTMSIGLEQYQFLVEVVEGHRGYKQFVHPTLEEWRGFTSIQKMMKPNSVGMWGLNQFFYSSNLEFEYRVSALLDAVRLLSAIRMYEITEGGPPEELAALVPTFLDALPIDPFSGNSYHYDQHRSVVWSVGPDGVDQRGSILTTYSGGGVAKQHSTAEDLVYSWKKTFREMVKEASAMEDKAK